MEFKISRLLTVASTAALLSLPLMASAATISVTETTDAFAGTVCTLRNAIQSVNTGGDFGGCVASGAYNSNDTINLTAQTYVLSVPGSGENFNETGDLDIVRSVNIVGAGSGQTIVSGSGFPGADPDRDFQITLIPMGTPGYLVNFQGLTIRDGGAEDFGSSGGGILIDVDVVVNLTDVLVTENEAGDGAGIQNRSGSLTLTNSQVIHNISQDDAGGIYNTSRLILIDSTVSRNEAQDDGGGILNFGEFLAVNSTLSRNIAIETIDNETSGIFDEGRGGGLFNGGELILVNSTISNNQALVAGGGIYSNSPDDDGLENSFATLFNVTVAQNSVEDGFGGGICYECDQVAVEAVVSQGGPVFSVLNSLIAENTADISPDCGSDEAFNSGGFNIIGDGTNCTGFTGTDDRVGVADVGIGDLQNNGGPTETHALLTGSPAIDTANDVEGCQGIDVQELINNDNIVLVDLTEDQRGFNRPIAVLNPGQLICDVGAFEFQTFDFTVTKDDGLSNQPIQSGGSFTYTITVANTGQGDIDNLTLSDPIPATLNVTSITPSQGTCSQAAAIVTCNLGTLEAGDSLTVAVAVDTSVNGTLTNVVTVSSNAQGEEGLSRTATEVTVVTGGGLIEGSGCSLNPASPSSGTAAWMGFVAMAALFGAWRSLRFNRQ